VSTQHQSNFLGSFLVSLSDNLSRSDGRCSNPSGFRISDSDDSAVDSAGDAVLNLAVELRNLVKSLLVSEEESDISLGRGIDHITDCVSLDSLVLGDLSSTVSAIDGTGVSSVALASAVVSSLDRH